MKYIPFGKLLLPQLDGVQYNTSTDQHKDAVWLYVYITKLVGKESIQIRGLVTTPSDGGFPKVVRMPSSNGLLSSSYTTFRGRKAYRDSSIQRTVENQKRFTSRLALEEKEHTYVLECTAPESLRKPATLFWEQFLKQIKENPTP